MLFLIPALTAPVLSVCAAEAPADTAGTGDGSDPDAPAGDEYVRFSDTAELPEVSAPGAVLMDADSGIVLYGKNVHRPLYPASTTKILTCLMAYDALELDSQVVFSHEAVFSVPRDASNIGIDENEKLTVEQALYATMAASANECANALGEACAGSISAFADRMNEKAAELGCQNSHFINTNGLFDEAHYTTPYDLGLISNAYFENSFLCMIANTRNYHIPQTTGQPDDIWILNHNQFINGERSMPGMIGGKTGYTEAAHASLVTCVERDGLRLICVVMGVDPPGQYNDTETLIRYGFENYRLETLEGQTLPDPETEKNAPAADENEPAAASANTSGTVLDPAFSDTPDYLRSGVHLLGSFAGRLEPTENISVLLPSGKTAQDLDASVRWHDPSVQNVHVDGNGNIRREIAEIDYYLEKEKVGSGTLVFITPASTLSESNAAAPAATRYIYVPPILGALFAGVCGLALLILLVSYVRSFYFGSSVLGRRLRKR